MEGDVVAVDRIWEDVPIPRSKRSRRVLRYRPGQVIPAKDVEALGVTPDGRQEDVPMALVDRSGHVPLQGPPLEHSTPSPIETTDSPPTVETTEGGPGTLETTEGGGGSEAT